MLREDLIPSRDIEAENKLKELILEIENRMADAGNTELMEEKLKEAGKYIKAKDRVLDLTVIEQYYSWTDLDGLVGELTMQVPTGVQLSEDELSELIEYLRNTLVNAEPDGDMDYKYNFYRNFFEENFPENDEAFDMIFEEDISVEDIVRELIYRIDNPF